MKYTCRGLFIPMLAFLLSGAATAQYEGSPAVTAPLYDVYAQAVRIRQRTGQWPADVRTLSPISEHLAPGNHGVLMVGDVYYRIEYTPKPRDTGAFFIPLITLRRCDRLGHQPRLSYEVYQIRGLDGRIVVARGRDPNTVGKLLICLIAALAVLWPILVLSIGRLSRDPADPRD